MHAALFCGVMGPRLWRVGMEWSVDQIYGTQRQLTVRKAGAVSLRRIVFHTMRAHEHTAIAPPCRLVFGGAGAPLHIPQLLL